ncbi:mitochondrial 54S ribosomal protein bL32m KNAG_0I01120 [Huiozyma naganishii CBS 8797]|uniref:Large ribosomal subunit protein bL32m n=1 Tax=Huiozyma naganishii (strain ATCC MYA-139 / BCRC 22969 / CBS 8797 / KCTC 17520 / NBRC 10181 / NCYC 3082 / Yp74L-3) TaxID=1071383 RepID=J7RQ54_HUIN7|nr:hypothetical protein KNAG_0I01120 [Kazachstania naganishii CBS 8797]CCK71903.1 hypothetical protein KNAG_0I01120 [Kazachstania naganishii CBS 8797]
MSVAARLTTGLSVLTRVRVGWSGWLLASPKKKTSHMKRRMRQLGPHATRSTAPLHSLGRCPSCGHIKRQHTLCMYCVGEIKHLWKTRGAVEGEKEAGGEVDPSLYPGRRDTAEREKLRDRDSYLQKRPRTLPHEN